jgi:hypothetical protein
LLKAGAVIDLTRDTGGILRVCLNTKSKKPQKPGRAPKPPKSSATKPAKSKPKTSNKPSKSKKSTGGRSVAAGKPNQNEAAASETVKAATDEPVKAE